MPQFSPGGNRAYTFADIISILNNDIANAGSPDLSLDIAFTLFAGLADTATMRDATLGGSVTAVANAVATWGGGSYGLIEWMA